LCQHVYPATDNLHDEIGVLGVEYHRRGVGAAELLEQRGLSFDRGGQLHEVMSDPPGWGPLARVCQPCRG